MRILDSHTNILMVLPNEFFATDDVEKNQQMTKLMLGKPRIDFWRLNMCDFVCGTMSHAKLLYTIRLLLSDILGVVRKRLFCCKLYMYHIIGWEIRKLLIFFLNEPIIPRI